MWCTHFHKHQYQNCLLTSFAHHIFPLGLPNVPFYFPLVPGREGQQFQQWIHIILSLFPPGKHQGLAGPDWRCNPCSIWPINIVHPASVSPPGWTSPKHLIMETSRRHPAHMPELTQQLCRKWKSNYRGCLLNLCPQERSHDPREHDLTLSVSTHSSKSLVRVRTWVYIFAFQFNTLIANLSFNFPLAQRDDPDTWGCNYNVNKQLINTHELLPYHSGGVWEPPEQSALRCGGQLALM